MRILIARGDEGLFISGAVRITQGQIFSKDFFEIVGPGTFYWLALFFKLFGVSFVASRACLFLTSFGTALSMFLLSRRICKTYTALPCILLAGTYWFMWPGINHHIDSNFFALTAIVSATWWLDTRARSMLFMAGALAGVTTWFMLPKGVLLMVALFVWVWMQHRWRNVPVSPLASLIAGYMVAASVVLLYFWSRGALYDLALANVLTPFRSYGHYNVVPYAMGIGTYYWDAWGFTHGFGIVIGIVLILPYILAAAIPGLLPVLSVSNLRSLARPEISLYWLCGAALWLSEIHRKDIFHLIFGAPLWFILLIYYVSELRVRIAKPVLQLISISASCLAGFNLLVALSAHPQETRFGKVEILKDDPIVRVLIEKTHPGDEIFAYPYCPMYYVLSGTKNPTRYSVLYGGSPAQYQETVRALEQHRVKYVVWNTHFQDVVRSRIFPAVEGMDPGPGIIEPYLESHYTQIWANETNRLMERKSDEAPREKQASAVAGPASR